MLHWRGKITPAVVAALVVIGAICGEGWTWL